MKKLSNRLFLIILLITITRLIIFIYIHPHPFARLLKQKTYKQKTHVKKDIKPKISPQSQAKPDKFWKYQGGHTETPQRPDSRDRLRKYIFNIANAEAWDVATNSYIDKLLANRSY
jgi:hypothetical protein